MRIGYNNLRQQPGNRPEIQSYSRLQPRLSYIKAEFCFSPETGQFEVLRYVTCEDLGTLINPQIVEGQVQGGVVQGLPTAMFEQVVYDENGQCLTADFENYKLAAAADIPNIEITHSTTKCPHTPLGQRGLGEGIPGPVTGALSNSVCDALAPFGIEINELPLRPNMIWRLLQEAKMKDAAD